MADETEDVSQELKALREELSLAMGLFYALGEIPIKTKEAKRAAEILDYADRMVIKAQDAVNSRVATEALGRPVSMEGAILSAIPDKAAH